MTAALPIMSKRDAKRWARADAAERLWNEWSATESIPCERADCLDGDCPDCAQVWAARREVVASLERGVEDLERPPWVDKLGQDAAPEWR